MTNMCVICNATVAASKKCNAEQDFMTMHKDYIRKYSDNSESYTNKAEDLKRNLRSRQAIFPKFTNKAKVATITSYKITENLAMKKKAFERGTVI